MDINLQKKGDCTMKTRGGTVMIRKVFAFMVIATFILGITGFANAKDDFPNRPITLNIGYKLGATTGLTGTVLAKILEEYLGQPIAIVDKSGATATIALGQVARAPADGYTLAIGSYSSIMTTPYEYDLPFDPMKDVDPIYAYTIYHAGFAVVNDSPWKTMREYLDWAKAHPGESKWASSGAMTFGHLVLEYIGFKEKIDWRPIGAKGGAEATKLALGKQINGLIMSSSQVPLIINGQMRYLCDFGYPKTPPIFAEFVKPEDLKNCWTLEQLGYPELAFVNPVIVYIRAGTPPEIRKKLQDAIRKATHDQRLKDITGKFSMPVVHDGGDEFFEKTKGPLQKLTDEIMTGMGRTKIKK